MSPEHKLALRNFVEKYKKREIGYVLAEFSASSTIHIVDVYKTYHELFPPTQKTLDSLARLEAQYG